MSNEHERFYKTVPMVGTIPVGTIPENSRGGGGTGLQTVVCGKVAAAGTDRIGGAGVVTHGVVGVVKDPAAEWQAGYEAGVEAAAKALETDARLCDCAALEDRECACGAWDDYKSITSARAVEIVRALRGQSQ